MNIKRKLKKIMIASLAIVMTLVTLTGVEVVSAASGSNFILKFTVGNNEYKQPVKYVQINNGVEQELKVDWITDGQEINLGSGGGFYDMSQKYFNQIEGYQFIGAYVGEARKEGENQNSTNVPVHQLTYGKPGNGKYYDGRSTLKYYGGDYYYHFYGDNYNSSFNNNNVPTITIKYKKVNPEDYVSDLKPITTVDTKNIDLKIFNYEASDVNNKSKLQFIGDGTSNYKDKEYNNNHDNYPTKGIVESELEYNESNAKYGNPKLSSDVISNSHYTNLDYLFGSNGKTANYLFKMVNGYYYYDSDENYAYFNEEDNNSGRFTVYNVAGAPGSNDAAAYKRGNFFPFNNIHNGAFFKERGSYNEGETKPTTSLVDLEDNVNNEYDQVKDVHFGMTMDSMFIQPKNGKINDDDMIFEFSGDDDVWVYIDGALVLDIGGIHAAQSGTINFATGQVTVSGDASHKEDTTLYNKMLTVYGQDYVDKHFIKKENGDYVFKNYSSHNIKFFYLERGAGASNCKLKFNIQSVPKESVTVKKEITNINAGSFSDVEFKFKLYLEDENGEKPYNGTRYKLYTEEGVTDEEGIFVLKHNEEHVFEDIADAGTKYFVEEIGLNQDEYDEVTVEGTVYDENNSVIKDEGTDGDYLIRTKELTLGQDMLVLFKNKCNTKNLHDIVIKKVVDKNNYVTSTDTYKMKVTIGGEDFNGQYKLNGVLKDDDPNTSGIIEMNANDVVTISNIAGGTSFNVVEQGLDLTKYKNPAYAFTGVDDDAYNDDTSTSGIGAKVIMSNNPEITVTNSFRTGKLTIVKTIDRRIEEHGNPIFTFKVTDKITGVEIEVYKVIEFDKNDSTTKSITITDLPCGNYTVEELDTIRYTCVGTKVRDNINVTEQGATETFVNNLTNTDKFSDAAVAENKFNVDESGKITYVTPVKNNN